MLDLSYIKSTGYGLCVIMALVHHLQRSPGYKCCACVRASNFAKIDFFFSPFRKVRLTANTTDEIDEDPTGTKAFWDRGLLNGAPQKVRSFFYLKCLSFCFFVCFSPLFGYFFVKNAVF